MRPFGELLAAALAADRNGLTKAGRALRKHELSELEAAIAYARTRLRELRPLQGEHSRENLVA